MDHFSDVFTNVSQLFILSVSLSARLLKVSDRLTQLPPVPDIAVVTGMSEERAAEFRSDFELDSDEMRNGAHYLSILDAFPALTVADGCNPISLSLVSVFEPGAEERRCYERSVLGYVDWLAAYANRRLERAVSEFRVTNMVVRVPVICVTVATTVAFIVTYGIITRRRASAVAVSSKIVGKVRSDVGFSLALFGFLWAMLIGAQVLLACEFEAQVAAASGMMQQNLIQMNHVSDIAQNGMASMALLEFSLNEDENRSEWENEAAERALLLINSTVELSRMAISEPFQVLEPFRHWSTDDRDSFSVLLLDYGNMLIGGGFRQDGYRFLMARALIVFNISGLGNTTLNEMTTASLFVLQEESASFWMVSIVFVFVGMFVTFALEFLHARRKVWFNGIKFVLRREMGRTPAGMRRVLELLSPENAEMLEKLPFPAILKDGEQILACNEAMAGYVGHSVAQMTGQRFAEYFPGENGVFRTENGELLKFHAQSIGDGLEFVRIEDLTEGMEIEASRQRFVAKMSSGLQLPFRGEVVFVAGRIRGDHAVLAQIGEVEAKYPEINRLLVGATFYQAISLGNEPETVMRFALELLRAFPENFTLAVTRGIVTVTGICENDVMTVANGVAVELAQKYLISGRSGFCYVQERLLDGVEITETGLIVPVS
jgi:hypothetical protein